MTREEAIIELKRKITCTVGGLSKEEYNATVMAIEALSADRLHHIENNAKVNDLVFRPSAEHKNCWDCNKVNMAYKSGKIDAENGKTDCTDFIYWIRKVVADEELWELNAVGYGEIICRKLVKIGALATTEKPPYYYVPSVSAERVGVWEHKDGVFGAVYCSMCGYELKENDTNYCPNCGARMKNKK